MNFQFTSKIKRNLIILIALGLVMFVIGFMGEKNHMYATLEESPEGVESLLVEYYQEMPISAEDFEKNVTEAADKEGIHVTFKNLVEAHGEDTHHKADSHGEKAEGEEAHAEKKKSVHHLTLPLCYLHFLG